MLEPNLNARGAEQLITISTLFRITDEAHADLTVQLVVERTLCDGTVPTNGHGVIEFLGLRLRVGEHLELGIGLSFPLFLC